MKFNFDINLNKFKCKECGNKFPIPYSEEHMVAPEGCAFKYTFKGKEYQINDGEIKLKVPSLSKMSDYSVICNCGNEVFNGKAVFLEYKSKSESEKSTLRKVIETTLEIISKFPG